MSNAKRDENRITMVMGVSDADGVTPLPLVCDPVTGRLLVEIIAATTSTSVAPNHVPHDQNRIPTGYAVTDDASLTLTPLIVDNRNNYLYVDLLIA